MTFTDSRASWLVWSSGVGVCLLAAALLSPFLSDLVSSTLSLPPTIAILWGLAGAIVVPILAAGATLSGLETRKITFLLALLAILLIGARYEAVLKEEREAQIAETDKALSRWQDDRASFYASARATACAVAAQNASVKFVRQREDAQRTLAAQKCDSLDSDFLAAYPRPRPAQVEGDQSDDWPTVVSQTMRWLGPGGLEALYAEMMAILGIIWAGFLLRRHEEVGLIPVLERLERALEEKVLEADKLSKQLAELQSRREDSSSAEIVAIDEEDDEISGTFNNIYQLVQRAPLFAEVDLKALADACPEALDGLDTIACTWRGWPIAGVKRRKTASSVGPWPYLDVRDRDRAVFVGTRAAISIVGRKKNGA